MIFKLPIIAAVSILIFSTPNASAQGNIDVRKLRFGAYVAPTINWMKPTATKDDAGEFAVQSLGSKVGYTWGLMVDYNFADNYAIVTGLQLNTSGGKILAERIVPTTNINSVQRAEFDYKVQYIEVPLALKLRTDEVSGFRFFGQLGITGGINLQKNATYTVNYNDAAGVKQVAIGDREKLKGTLAVAPVLFQMNIGAGADYPITDKLKAYFGLFFNNGFLPDATNPNNYELNYAGEFRDANTRLNNFAIRLGLFF